MKAQPASLPDGLPRTWRVIGLAVAAGGRALDIALVETDGAAHVRHVETERQLLNPPGSLVSLVALVNAFMGNRALQPFAVDLIALAPDATGLVALTVGQALDVTCIVSPPEGTPRRGGRATRAAFAAATAMAEPPPSIDGCRDPS